MYLKALSFFERTNDAAGLIYSLGQIGICYTRLGDLDQAESYLKRALHEGELLGERSPETGLTYLNLGYYYSRKYGFGSDSCLHAFQRAVEISSTKLPRNDPRMAMCYRGLAYYYSSTNEYSLSRNYYEKAIEILEVSAGNYTSELARNITSLASINRQMGAVYRARRYLAEAINLYQTIPHWAPSGRRRALTILANTHFDAREYEVAREIYRNVVSMGDPFPGSTFLVVPLANLGSAYTYMGDFDLAKQSFQQAIAKSDRRTSSLLNLSHAYEQFGDYFRVLNQYDSARHYLDKSLDIRKRIFGAKSVYAWSANYYISQVYLLESDFDQSLKYAQQGLIALEPHFENEDVNQNPNLELSVYPDQLYKQIAAKADIFFLKYRQSNDLKDLQSSLEQYLAIDELTDMVRNGPYTELTKLNIAAIFKQTAEKAIECLNTLYKVSADRRHLEIAFRFMEKNRYNEIFGNLSRVQALTSTNIPDSIYQDELAISTRMRILQFQMLSVKDSVEKTRISREILTADREYQTLQGVIQNNYSSYHQAKYDRMITLEEVQKSLDQETQVLEYFYGDGSISILSITTEETDFRSIELTAEFEHTLSEFLEIISQPIDVNRPVEELYSDYAELAFSLYDGLVGPLRDKEKREIVLSADGMLAMLPFEVLVTDSEESDFRNAPYLLKELSIQYAYSLNLLHKFKPSKEVHRPSLLAFGYSEGSGPGQTTQRGELSEIPATAREVLAVSKAFKGRNNEYLIGPQASETAFKELASGYEIIHLAVHGIGDTISALQSKLVFRNGNDTINDGQLYAHELYGMDLEKLQLAVLSACETGIGKEFPGEGMFSMARGFAYAGCPSIVMSLWQVNDEFTAKVMDVFYQKLYDGESIPDAIREAKLSYLQESSILSAHPYYWSGFVSLGDPDPVRKKGLIMYVLSGLLVMLVVGILMRRFRK